MQLVRLLARKDRLYTEWETAKREADKACREYEVACIDLRYAEKKRKIADDQLNLAQMGTLGIDYKPDNGESDVLETV